MDGVINGGRLETYPDISSDRDLERTEKEVKVTVGDKVVNININQTINTKSDAITALTVVFLHGGKFSSQNWVDIKTLDYVASWGHMAVAVDLPGKGKSPEAIQQDQYPEFMAAFIVEMAITNVVLVAPSSSGRYALPYLFKEPKTSTQRAVGFIPIAPGATQDFREKYSDSQLQTLIVYGTKDPAGATTLNDLMLLPNRDIHPIEGAGHSCYLDNPEVFHKVLYNFLNKLAR